jgi:IS5 family transposase
MIRREKSLEEIGRILPWATLKSLISWHYAKAANGRPPMGLRIVLCILFLQHWPSLSDPAGEEVLYDSPALICERKSG